jgi:hypothetical protein
MHYGGNDWAIAQIAGLKSEFANLHPDPCGHRRELQTGQAGV